MNINGIYTNINLITSNEYYIQNTGSEAVELYIGSGVPLGDTEGFVIEPKKGFYVKISDDESAYIKTESPNGVSRVVTSPEVS